MTTTNQQSATIHATTDAFDEQVLGSGVALVDFWATWCPPCRVMGPVVDELAADFAGEATIAKVDVDANGPLAERYAVSSIPTFVLFKDGREIDRFVGVVPKDRLADRIRESL